MDRAFDKQEIPVGGHPQVIFRVVSRDKHVREMVAGKCAGLHRDFLFAKILDGGSL